MAAQIDRFHNFKKIVKIVLDLLTRVWYSDITSPRVFFLCGFSAPFRSNGMRKGISADEFRKKRAEEEGGSLLRGSSPAGGKIPKIRRCHNESKNYNGMHRVQTTQLRHHQEQKEQPRSS